jgi:hypothetical protein
MKNFNQKLWDIKNNLPKFKKASKGFKFKYTNLSDIEKGLLPVLEKYKIGYTHHLDTLAGNNVLVTTIFDLESDVKDIHRLTIPNDVKLAGMNDYQSLGSALTYFRRYHLVVAFGILTDEDVDALTPAVAKTDIKHVEKVKQLISIGRAKSTLEKYFRTYESKMTTEDKKIISELINNTK